MKDIKLKPQQRTPRILSKAKRMPRQVARYALLQAKERSKAALQESVAPEQKETPESYVADKVLQKGEQLTAYTGRAAYALGKKLHFPSGAHKLLRLHPTHLQRHGSQAL